MRNTRYLVQKHFCVKTKSSILSIVLLCALIIGFIPASVAADGEEIPTVSTMSHIQSYGWISETSPGLAGIVASGKRLEAIRVLINGMDGLSGAIEYSPHVQSFGWMPYAANGATSGTTGLGKRIEAVKIRLTGEIAQQYDVYYRSYVQSFGWLGWAKNDENSGTSGIARRLEALEIRIVGKGQAPSGPDGKAFLDDAVALRFRSHFSSLGWVHESENGGRSGTPGGRYRMEALQVLFQSNFAGSVRYKSYVQGSGWETSWSQNGETSGTTGKALPVEAIMMELTGTAFHLFDIYYRVCVSNFGWLGWAKNSEPAGTENYKYPIEAIEIKVVSKASASPGSSANAFRKRIIQTVPPSISKEAWYNGFVDPRSITAEVVEDPSDIAVLVNKYHTLPDSYVPPLVSVKSSAGQRLHPDAAAAWNAMYDNCFAETGQRLYLVSGYRSIATQKAIFNNAINSRGVAHAIKWNAYPGRSEHNLGLAMDISYSGNGISDNFLNTTAGKWVMENAHKYGVILRYLQGKESVTGYGYEPWHFRYLGVDLATKVYTSGQAYEEYLGVR